MSRSAEIRQMMIQQRVAEERKMLMATGELVDPDVHVEREGEVMLSGNERTFNINTMLAENIRDSDYFNRQCLRLREFEDIIQEAFDKLDHVEPWSAGSSRHPSTAFCLLMRLFVLRLTHSELNILLGNKRSPHVRAIGFLYIRYGLFRDPHLWDWLAPYVDDPEEFSPGVDGKKITMGGFVRILLDEPKYYGTLLPRIPVPTMRKIRAKLLDLRNTDKRELKNARYASLMVPGTRVEAMYEGDRLWYPAVVERVMPGRKIEVNFVDYDELATVPFGAIRIPADVRKELQRAKSREREEEAAPPPRGDGAALRSPTPSRAPRAERGPSPRGHSREGRGRGSPPPRRSKSREAGASRRRSSRSRSHSRSGRRDRDRNRDRDRDRDRHRSRRRDERRDRGVSSSSRRRRKRDSRSRSRSRSGRRRRGSSRSRPRSRSPSPRGSRGGRARSSARSPIRGTAHRGSPLDDGYSDEEADIEAMVREREREAAATSGKDYAQRPSTLKGAIQLDAGKRSLRSRSPSPSEQVVPRKRAQEPQGGSGAGAAGAGSEASAGRAEGKDGAGVKAKEAEAAEQQPPPPPAPASTEARRKLVAMYGDVSGESDDKPAGHSLYEGSEVVRVGTRR